MTARISLGFPLAVVVALSGFAARAGEDTVRFNSFSSIFGIRFPVNAWTPVVARAENPSAAPIRAIVSLELPAGVDPTQFTRPVLLPAHSQRRVQFPVRLDYPLPALRALFVRRDDMPPLTFADGTQRRQDGWRAGHLTFPAALWSESGSVRGRQDFTFVPIHPDAFHMIVVDLPPRQRHEENWRADGLPFVRGESPADRTRTSPGTLATAPRAEAWVRDNDPETDGRGRIPMSPSRIAPGYLPDRAAAYGGVDAVVLGGLRDGLVSGGLDPARLSALRDYVVHTGGRLVILPAADPDAFADPVWDELLPADIAGLAPLSAAAAALAATHGEAPPDNARAADTPDTEVWFAELLPRPEAYAVVSGAGRVLAAGRRVGTGEVWMLAVPGEALAGWSRANRLWEAALRSPPPLFPGLPGAVAEEAGEMLAGAVGARTPESRGVTLVLSVYFLLCAFALVRARRRGTGERGWVAVILFSVLAGAALTTLSLLTRGQTEWTAGSASVAVLRAGGGGTAAVTEFLGLYSPTERSGDLVWGDPDALAAPLGDFAVFAADNPVRSAHGVVLDRPIRFPDLRLKPGELFRARSDAVIPLADGVDATLTWTPEGPIGTVTNRTGRPLEQVYFRIGRRHHAVGTLPDGATRSWSDRPWTANPGAEWVDTDVARWRRTLFAEALRRDAAAETRDGTRRHEGPAAVFGWRPATAAALTLGGVSPADVHSFTLLGVRLDAAPPPSGARVTIPAGVCGLRFFGIGAGTVQLFGDPDRPTRPGTDAPPPGVELRRPEPVRPAMPLPGMPEIYESFEVAPEPSYDRRHDFAGWRSGELMPPPARMAFTPPAGLERLRVETMRLRLDLTATGLMPRLRVRRVGAPTLSQGWTPVELPETTGRGETTLAWNADELAPWMGPDGQWPEWELSFHPAALGEITSPTNTQWEIRRFDLEVEGVQP